jgi:hypothetical protein
VGPLLNTDGNLLQVNKEKEVKLFWVVKVIKKNIVK